MNRSHARILLRAALDGFRNGSAPANKLSKFVPVEDFGRQIRIDEGLTAGINFLPELLNVEGIDLFDRAFASLGKKRPSDRTDVCAKILLNELRRAKRHAAWSWAVEMKLRPANPARFP